MSKLSPVLGALRGYEQGQQTLEETKLKIVDAMQRLREYKEVTVPTAEAQIQESGARTELYREQIAGIPVQRKNAATDLLLNQMRVEEAQKRFNELKKFADANPNIPVWSGGVGEKAASEVAQANLAYYKAQNDLAIQQGWVAGGGKEEEIRGKIAATEETTQKAVTGAEAEGLFARGGGAALIAQERKGGLETKIAVAPINVEQAIQEMQQAQITTREMQAGEPYKIASFPLTQQLLQTQVDQANQNLSVSQTYDMNQAQANLESTQENIARTKKEIQRIATEMKDKTVLDGLAVNSGLTNPITNKPVTTWDEYKLIMDFKLDEQLAMVKAKSSGSSGLPTMSQNVDRITLRPDATLFGGKIPYKSEETVINFISFIDHFLEAGQNPYAAWTLARMQYVTSEPWDALKRDAATSNDIVSQRFIAGYLPPDMVVNEEQTQRVMAAIREAVSEQARTSAAGGTPELGTKPNVYGPPATSGVRERVATTPGSITESQDTTFGLDRATRIRIAGIIDVYGDQPDMQGRLITEIEKETDMGKRDKMVSFAEWHYNKKKR